MHLHQIKIKQDGLNT